MTVEPVARSAATGPVPVSLAQIAAALSVTYSEVGVAVWLAGENRGLGDECPLDAIALGRISEVAARVRLIGDADPADFEIVDRSGR